MPQVKEKPLARALDKIASPDLVQRVLEATVAVLQEAWQESAKEKKSDKEMAAESRVYGKAIEIAQDRLSKVGVITAPIQSHTRHVRPDQMPKTTPATQKE